MSHSFYETRKDIYVLEKLQNFKIRIESQNGSAKVIARFGY